MGGFSNLQVPGPVKSSRRLPCPNLTDVLQSSRQRSIGDSMKWVATYIHTYIYILSPQSGTRPAPILEYRQQSRHLEESRQDSYSSIRSGRAAELTITGNLRRSTKIIERSTNMCENQPEISREKRRNSASI